MMSCANAPIAASHSRQSESPAELRDRLESRLELCRRDLAEFHSYVNGWPVPEHQRRLCDLWEWVEQTPDARLVVTMPPRHGKTETELSALAWMLGRNRLGIGPINRVALAMYGVAPAAEYSGQVRDLFDRDGIARDVFPSCTLAGRDEKAWRFDGQAAGRPNMIAVGVGGPFTGRGADVIAIDDPIKDAEEARSDTYRERHWRWWQQVARTRLHPGGRVVVTMTRWHEDDLAGRLLQSSDWQHIHLPAIDDGGNALWPERYPVETLLAMRDDPQQVGPQAFEALYQGRPTPSDGDVWRREWFDANSYAAGKCPGLLSVITAWDTAFKAKESADYTAWCRAGLDGLGHVWVLDVGRERLEFPALCDYIEAGRGGTPDEIALIEDAASGQSAIQTLQRGRRGVVAVKVDADKEARARAVTPQFQAGRVHLPADHAMYEAMVGECTSFPYGRHDDMHDALVHAVQFLTASARSRGLRKVGVVA